MSGYSDPVVPSLPASDGDNLDAWVHSTSTSLVFNADVVFSGTTNLSSVELKPFYDTHHTRYTVYWNLPAPPVGVLPEGETVAYWTFEEGAADAYVSYSQGSAGQYDGSILDVSGSGNHLSVWAGSWEWYRADAPASTTPQIGVANTLSVQNANDWNAMSAIGTSLTTWNPTNWTIEAAFKTDRTTGYQTLVGRDSSGAYSGDAALSVLYLAVRPGGSIAITFVDNAGNRWNIDSAAGVVEVDQWQAAAAVSDGSTLSLYLKNITAAETNYTLMGSLDISGSADCALSTGAGDGAYWDAGVITVGRGLYNGEHTDRLFGYIDDVRLSDAALTTNQFLYSTLLAPLAPTGLTATPGDGSVSLDWADNAELDQASYTVYRSTTSGSGYAIIASGLTTRAFTDDAVTNGVIYYYVVTAANAVGTSANSAQVSVQPVSAVPADISFSLGGDQFEFSWPADHTGWRLQMSTNLLEANWQDVVGAESTNFISIQSTNSSTFFRLVYP